MAVRIYLISRSVRVGEISIGRLADSTNRKRGVQGSKFLRAKMATFRISANLLRIKMESYIFYSTVDDISSHIILQLKENYAVITFQESKGRHPLILPFSGY